MGHADDNPSGDIAEDAGDGREERDSTAGRRDALASAEADPHREVMAEGGSDAGIENGNPPADGGGQAPGQIRGQRRLADVADQDQCRIRNAQLRAHVGHAGIARADLIDTLPARNSHHGRSRQKIAQHISR